MDVVVLSRDLMFFSAVEAMVNRLGHTARQAESLEEVESPDLLVADFVSSPLDVDTLAQCCDPSRLAIFTPHERVDVFRDARALGIARVYRRGALDEELPKILAAGASLSSRAGH